MKTNIRNILLGALLAIGLGVPYLQAADVKISAMPAGSALAGTEQIPAVQGGATVKTTPAAIKTFVETGGTVTASDPVLDLTQTWNSGAVTFTAEKTNVTDTASAAGSLLRDWQVGGASKFTIDKSGAMRAYSAGASGTPVIALNNLAGTAIGFWSGAGSASANLALTSGVATFTDSNAAVGFSSGNLAMRSTGDIRWSSGATLFTTVDLSLLRGGAGILQQRNGTNAQTLQVFDTYTDSSNYGRLALNTSLTGDWVQVAAETAGTGGDNYGIALTPTGTGAISAQVPDSATAGGNARGANAVDWSAVRANAAQVASGQTATIGGGSNNTATGIAATVAGGTNNQATGSRGVVAGGDGNTATATYSATLGGLGNTATGQSSVVSGGEANAASGINSWVPGGIRATTRGLSGAGAYSAGRRTANGDAQVILQPVRSTTTDATPVSLATDGTPAATTVMVLPSDSTATCRAMVTANNTAAGVVSMAGFDAIAIVKNDSSTMTISGGTCTAIGTADAALTTATCALVANGTLDSIEMQVTGVAATTVYWVAEVKCVQAL